MLTYSVAMEVSKVHDDMMITDSAGVLVTIICMQQFLSCLEPFHCQVIFYGALYNDFAHCMSSDKARSIPTCKCLKSNYYQVLQTALEVDQMCDAGQRRRELAMRRESTC